MLLILLQAKGGENGLPVVIGWNEGATSYSQRGTGEGYCRFVCRTAGPAESEEMFSSLMSYTDETDERRLSPQEQHAGITKILVDG